MKYKIIDPPDVSGGFFDVLLKLLWYNINIEKTNIHEILSYFFSCCRHIFL
jgi:hypothetical protein